MRFRIKHPITERGAAIFHGLLFAGCLLEVAFHAFAMVAHWLDRERKDTR